MFDTIFRQERAEKAYNENKDNGNPDKAEGVTPMEVGELIEKWEITTRTEENGKYILEDIAEAIKDVL